VFSLYGADVLGRPFGIQVLIAALHLAGLGLAGWALFRAIRRFLSWDEPLIQVLAVAIVLNVARSAFQRDGQWGGRDGRDLGRRAGRSGKVRRQTFLTTAPFRAPRGPPEACDISRRYAR